MQLPATITQVPVAAVLVLNTPDYGHLRPKHVELLCRNKTSTVLHQVGVSFDLRHFLQRFFYFSPLGSVPPILNSVPMCYEARRTEGIHMTTDLHARCERIRSRWEFSSQWTQ